MQIYKELPKGIVREILKEGDYLGYHYCIITLGSHPCAYIENKHGFDIEWCEENISCNGGVTWFGHCLWNEKDHRQYIGWDYGHCWDYTYFPYSFDLFNKPECKKWTLEEIFEEVMRVAEQLDKGSKRKMSKYIEIKKLEEERTINCNCCLSDKNMYLINFLPKGCGGIQVCLCKDCLNELKEVLNNEIK